MINYLKCALSWSVLIMENPSLSIYEKPLVTLAIFSFNQEEYVRKAVESAFSQTYEPLEIILSDDCSSDHSFEIIQKMAEDYSGPHSVVVNRNDANLSTLGHFFKVADMASGQLLVLAAADDVSKPERVEVSVDFWKKTGCSALFSDYDLIDESDSVLQKNYNPGSHSKMLQDVFGASERYEVHGASSAYDLSFVKSLPRPSGKFFFEDAYMTFMLNLYSKCYIKIAAPLVFYREHSGSISNSSKSLNHFSQEMKREISMRGAYKNRYLLSVFLMDYADSLAWVGFNRDQYFKQLKKFKVKSEWHEMSFLRMSLLLASSDFDRSFKKWILPRVFGLRFFVALKVMFRCLKILFRGRYGLS